MNKIGMQARENIYELSDQDLDSINGGCIPPVVVAALVVAVVTVYEYYQWVHNLPKK